MHGHARAEARNLRLHQLAFEKMRRQPELKAKVLALLDRWIASEDQQPSRPWLLKWREMLQSWPIDRMTQEVLDREGGETLRQCSPLAPVLTPRERWAALKLVSTTPLAKKVE